MNISFSRKVQLEVNSLGWFIFLKAWCHGNVRPAAFKFKMQVVVDLN